MEVEGQNKRFYFYQGCVLGGVGLIVLIGVPILTKFIGGHLKTYSDITTELFLLFAGYALCIPWYHSQNYFLAYGRGVELMKVTIGASLLGFMFLALSIWQFGAIGVYVGFLGQLTGKSVIAMFWARRIWKINVPWEGTFIALLLLGVGSLLPKL